MTLTLLIKLDLMVPNFWLNWFILKIST